MIWHDIIKSYLISIRNSLIVSVILLQHYFVFGSAVIIMFLSLALEGSIWVIFAVQVDIFRLKLDTIDDDLDEVDKTALEVKLKTRGRRQFADGIQYSTRDT